MNGKSRWADNIKEAREAIQKYIYTYNVERCHQAINYK